MNPDDCQNMADIRREIDAIDHQVIQLLGKRKGYVHAASKFKTSASNVKAPERLKTMLVQRRSWAEAAELDPDVIEKLYQDLVNYFIATEMKEWQSNPSVEDTAN